MKSILRPFVLILMASFLVLSLGCPSGSDPLDASNDKDGADGSDSYLYKVSTDNSPDIDPPGVEIIVGAEMKSVTATPSRYNDIEVEKVVLRDVSGTTLYEYNMGNIVEIGSDTLFALGYPNSTYSGPATYTFYGHDVAGHEVDPLVVDLDVFCGSLSTLEASPANGIAGCDITLTLSGGGALFVNLPTVTFDGVPATAVVFNSDTMLTVTVPAHADGEVSIVVTNPAPDSQTFTTVYTYDSTLLICP